MKIRCDKRRIRTILIIFILIFPHMRPSSIARLYPFIGRLFIYGSVISFFTVLVFLVSGKKRKIKTQKTLMLIFIMELWIVFTSIIHKTDSISDILIDMISSVSIPLIMYYFSDRMDELLSAMMLNYEWLIYTSLVSIILYYPHGMYISGSARQYFLGNENGIIFYALPAMLLAFIYIRKERKYLRGILLILACLANEIIVWCATAIVGLAVAGLVILFSLKRKRRVNYYLIFFVILAADVVVSVLRSFDQYSIFIYIINNLLQKSMTLTRRTYIWERAMALIPSALGTGLGRGDHIFYRGSMVHAHNEYFQVLLVGGIPLLILLLILLLYLGKIINRNRRVTYANLMILAMITCLLIQFIATSRLTFRLYVPLMLASYVDDIDYAITKRRAESSGTEPGKRRRIRAHFRHMKTIQQGVG